MPGELSLRDDRESRALARRYAAMLVVSLLFHVLLGLGLIVLGVDPPALADDDEIFVPLTLEAPAEPPPPAPEPEASQAADETEEPEQPDVPEDASLLGFRSEGSIKARPDRPVGPEAEIHGSAGAGGGEAQSPPEEIPADEPEVETDEPPVELVEEAEPEPLPSEPEPIAGPPQEEPPGETVETTRRADDFPSRGTPEPLLPPLETPRPVQRPAPDRPRGPGKSALDFDVGIEGGMFGNLDFDSPDYNWSDYSTKVYFAVYRSWLRELHARARRFEREQKLEGMSRLEGEVAIHFVINRDGSVSNLEIVSPSVIGNLDAASSASLLGAVLPQLPGDFPRDSEGVTFRFVLSVDNALLMERVLSYRRSRGEF